MIKEALEGGGGQARVGSRCNRFWLEPKWYEYKNWHQSKYWNQCTRSHSELNPHLHPNQIHAHICTYDTRIFCTNVVPVLKTVPAHPQMDGGLLTESK